MLTKEPLFFILTRCKEASVSKPPSSQFKGAWVELMPVDHEYVGLTKRQLGTRMKEHQKVAFQIQLCRSTHAYQP